MTTTQDIIWAALPMRVSPDGRPQLSVAVSPRLRTDESPPRLGLFDEFPHWPEAVNGMTFGVSVKGQAAEVPTQRLGDPADPALWGRLFTEDTVVRPFKFKDHSTRNIRSFPVHAVMTYLAGLYQTIAQLSPDDLPLIAPEEGQDPRGTLAGLIEELGGVLWHYRLPKSERDLDLLRKLGLPDVEALGIDPSRQKDVAAAVRRAAARRRFNALEPAFQQARVLDPGADPADFGFTTQAALDFYQAHRFYDRPEDQHEYLAAPDPTKIPRPPEVREIDFHRMIAALGDYPVLLRRLGLVVDLAVDGDLPPTGEIRAHPHRGGAPPVPSDRRPWTSYQLSGNRFLAASLDPAELSDGLVALDGADDDFEGRGGRARFSLVQVDADGAALKAVNMAVGLRSLQFDRAQGRVSFDSPDRTGLPPMRSVGIGVFRRERAVAVHQRLQDAVGRNDTPDLSEVINSAEHLVRGYRVDVFDADAGQWRSLCQRRGTYRIHRADGPPIEVTQPDGSPIVDEGYLKAASTTSADAESSDLYLHEAMFSWDGWSPVAQRPGRTIYPVPSADGLHQDEQVGRRPPELATEFKLETSFRPIPGSLPRLRFGKTYRFRVRTVDLAGNSLDVDEADDTHASGEIFYARFDPVIPPTVVPRARMADGESIERLVIRSNFDRTAEEYASDLQPDVSYSPTNDRHVVPPKTSQQMAETHGRFDAAFGPSGDPAAGFDIAVREAATLEHTHVLDPATGQYEPVPGSEIIAGTLPPDASPGARAQGDYLINTRPLFPLAYLPDVLARGVAFRRLPGVDGADLREFTGDWPDATPFVLRIAESPGVMEDGRCDESLLEENKPPQWDEDNRILTVFLPKATIAVVRYSCYLDAEHLPLMAAWRRWMVPSADAGSLKELAATGGHWMLTPYRELVLVHAVQQPLCPPTVRLDSNRFPGAMFAELSGKVHLSVRSTGQIDLEAVWSEPIDNLSDPGPKELDGHAQVAALRVDDWLPEQETFEDLPPNLDGTLPVPGHGGLPLPFPALSDLPPGTQFTEPDAEGFLDVDDLMEFKRETIKHEFGDTKHRWVWYHPVGTTRFREYLPASIAADRKQIIRPGDEILVNILSSARPEAPRVRYLVPSFRWKQDPGPEVEQWTRLRRTRVGGGLRVWMDRPWFTSGEGEKLAAVLWPRGYPPDERFAKLVSQFGADPAWDSARPRSPLGLDDFAGAVNRDQNLVLDEAPGPTNPRVSAVAFDVEYRDDRNLWFCDIDLAPRAGPSYFPFVRLALARYQRHSVNNATKLSRVVQTDFHQLVPDRTLTVTFTSPERVDVTLYGPAPWGPIRNRVEVLVEHHDGKIPGDLGWKPVPSTGAWRNPIHLSDGAPDVSWIPPALPTELIDAAGLRRRALRVEGRAARISEANLPRISVTEVPTLGEVDPDLLHGLGSLPIFAIPGYQLWSGKVQLPVDESLGDLRLLVREFEHFEADPDVGRIDRDRRDPQIAAPYLDRVVYADIVNLPRS